MDKIITELTADRFAQIAPLFADMDDTTILTGLQGRCGGRAWADDAENPCAALILVGGVKPNTTAYGFLAGDYTILAAKALTLAIPRENEGDAVFMPQNDGWCRVIEETYGSFSQRCMRYATSKKEDNFDTDRLRKWAQALPQVYELSLICADDYVSIEADELLADNVANYADGDDFEQNGLGIKCVHEGKIISAASSYTSYDGGIEIEIATLPEYRRRGIARACASRLILECLERGLYPSWDAANEKSIALAKSLGYVFAGEYPSYKITGRPKGGLS